MVKFSPTFDFLIRDNVATDTVICPCFDAIAHARLSEAGSEMAHSAATSISISGKSTFSSAARHEKHAL